MSPRSPRSSRSTRSTRSSTVVARPADRPAAADAGRSRLGDLTRPIPIERRITKRRRTTVLLGLVAVAIAGALAASLFVLPVQTWFSQEETLEQRQARLDQLESVNAELEAEVRRLRTDVGAREAAREQIGFAEIGEQRLTVMALPELPTQLPAGWPYDLVTQVIEVRRVHG